MTGETAPTTHLSFEELGTAIETYNESGNAYSEACFINIIYDEEGSTLTGQDLEDWKQEFPRVDDEELARLKQEQQDAEAQFMETLGLESSDVIPALLEAYANEKIRRKQENELGSEGTKPYTTAITVSSANPSIEPRDMIAGVLCMSKLTHATYVMHAGQMIGKTYAYVTVAVEPSHETDDIVTRFKEKGGLTFTPETNQSK